MAYNPYTGRWEMDGAQQIQLQPMPRPQGPQLPPQPPKLGVLTVASEASINNLQMQPNDNALALHETENLLYYIRTDSMAAKTIARFRIFPEPTEEEKAEVFPEICFACWHKSVSHSIWLFLKD